MRIGLNLSGSLLAAALAFSFAATAQAAIAINIDKNTQRMTVAVDGETRYVWPVSTGRPGYETPNGSFKINRMDADHQSQEWDGAPMPYTMFFDLRGHAIHGFSDVKHLGMPVSHGCVRLLPANAATLFALVQSQGMSQVSVVVSGQIPARGDEMARRRAPTEQAAAQPTQAPPGYADYQPAPPQAYDGQNYGQQTYGQQTYGQRQPYDYRQAQQPAYAQPPQGYYQQQAPRPYYGQQQPYYAQQQPYYGQQQPYYAQQQPGYIPPQPPPVYRPFGQY